VRQTNLGWQSKLILLAVLPFAAVNAFFESSWYLARDPRTALWTIGLSALLGLITWRARAATLGAAATGATITASLMFSTTSGPFAPWHTALIPLLAVSIMAFAATRIGRGKKERLGKAEARRGRQASQIAANLGVAALVSLLPAQMWLVNAGFVRGTLAPPPVFYLGLAALAEAAADTVSSEIGQVLAGQPRLITSLRAVEAGIDGAVSLAGTLAGIVAAAVVAAAGAWALGGRLTVFAVASAGAVFGLFFDSLLGATLEQRGWLNNDTVNFLSTASAAAFALLLLALAPRPGVG